MFYQTKQLTITRALGSALLASLLARPAAPLLTTPNLHLFSEPVELGPNMTLDQFTQADFPGYATVAVGALAGPVNTALTTISLETALTFIAGTILVPQNTYGYYVTDTTNAILYAAESFPTAMPFTTSGDFLTVQLAFPQLLQPFTGL